MKTKKPRVLVAQPLLAHYRQDVLVKLIESETMDFVIAAGKTSSDGDIATFTPSNKQAFVHLANRHVGPLLWQQGLLPLIFSNQFDAVIVTGSAHHISAWAAGIVCKIRRIPLMFWTTGWHRPESGIKRQLRMAFYSLADLLLLYGQRGRDIGLRMGYPRSRMTVIYNSTPSASLDTWSNASPYWDTNDDQVETALQPHLNVAFVGRLTVEKELPLLFESCKILSDKGFRLQIVIGGDGPARSELTNLAGRLNLDVVFVGNVYSAVELAEIYSKAMVSVIPGRAGLTVVQSMAHGIPVVTHSNFDRQVAEADAILPGRTGYFFKAGDSHDLAAVLETIAEQTDEDRKIMQDACLSEWHSTWSPTNHARRIEESVKRLLTANDIGKSE